MRRTIRGNERGCIGSYSADIMNFFASEYSGIVKVDLESGLAGVLKFDSDKEIEGSELLWETLTERFADKWVYTEDRDIIRNLSREKLKECYEHNMVFPIEFRCICKDKVYDWVRILGAPVSDDGRYLLITARIINEERLRQKIIELFVYQNFDYVILVDAKCNSYITFNGKTGLSLPPMNGDNYDAEVKRYNDKYVVADEVTQVTANMSIAHVVSMLEKQESYSFTIGAVSDAGKFRRTRVQFTYYDRSAGLILLTRMDITKLYLEEVAKEQKLKLALKAAQYDSMTELYNKKAMYELVDSALKGQYYAQSALLFIDIDNFKLVNDTFGHQRGDELLRYVANIVNKVAGDDGIAGRIGGDEFLLFLPVNKTIGKIEECAERICLSFHERPELELGSLPVSCSVGVSVYPMDGTEFGKLLYKADQALYDAKRFGKCQFAFYSESIKERRDRGRVKDEYSL